MSKDVAAPIVKERCLKLLAEGGMADVPFLLSLCAEFLQSEDQAKARELYVTLAESVDPMRSKYWRLKADKLAAA